MLFTISLMNLSSPQSIWLIVNQFQLFQLLFLTGAYIPKNVKDFLSEFQFMLFSFNDLIYIGPLEKVKQWLDYSQKRRDLLDIDVESGSTFVNTVPLLLMMLLIL